MYCESAAWGRAARALRHPPTLPESAVSVATRAERGGRRRMVKVKRQFQTWWEKHGWMDGWMSVHIYWRLGEKRRWHSQWGAWAVFSTSQQWQIDSWRQTTAANTEGNFRCQWQPRSRSWLRGLNHLNTDNVSLWNLIQPYAFIQRIVFLCPLFKQIIQAWSWSDSGLVQRQTSKELKSIQQVLQWRK